MTVLTPSSNPGRHVFGVAALAFGVITLAWHDYNDSHRLRYIVYSASAALMFGGAAIQLRRTAKTGAAVLGAAYLVFALLCVPRIVAAPQIYNSWGNLFEQFSLLTGATVITIVVVVIVVVMIVMMIRVGVLGVENFQRHTPTEVHVLGLVHHAGGAAADLTAQSIMRPGE